MRLVILSIFVVLFLAPVAVDAQIYPGGPAQLVPCNGPDCGTCEFVDLINNVVGFILWFGTIAATLIVIYAGFRLVTSAGDVGAKTKAKTLLTNVLIGYVLLLSAFLIVNTLMSLLVPSGSGLLNWNQIQCFNQADFGAFDESARTRAIAGDDNVMRLSQTWNNQYGTSLGITTGNLSGGGQFGGGTCTVPASGNCSPSSLSCFGARANDAAQVCSVESGGNALSVSGTDLCRDRRSFSGGLMQINILANNRYFNNCSPDFFEKTGSGAQGNCLQWVENSGGVRYCQIRDCRITNVPKYEACMAQTLDPRRNIQISCDLFRASGNDFDPWITSARRCNVQ
jgi:hypothetical protein